MINLFTNLRRGLALAVLFATGSLAAQAQGVGIGTTAPDVSAALDIVSSSKGALLPRVANAPAIATPATGLLVFQTGGTPGFYYNAGTPGAPSWQQLATATGTPTTASNGITKTGNNIALGGPLSQATTISQAGNTFSLTGGNVGIGTATPGYKLDVAGNANVTGDSYVSGMVGIGTTTPAGGLQVLTGNAGVAGGGVSGVVMSGAPGNVPYMELRGGSAGSATTPYIDFAETNNVDYSIRLSSQNGTLNVDGSNPATTFRVNGNATVTGQLTANSFSPSDARLKENIRSLGGALASVLALRGVRYTYRHNLPGKTLPAGEQMGLIAQEIEKIYPELVATGADGYKAVNYAQLAPVLIEAIKEQQTQIEALKAQVAAQASDHAALQAVKARAEADHADLQTLQAQIARLLSETTAIGTQARR